jgi:DhnA family fructose-bisphosphate aldolase class Ia
MTKRLDEKLARIRTGAHTPRDFIIADAKDGDMAFGCATPGPQLDADGRPTGRFKPLSAYRADMKRVLDSDLVDIMLTSLSTAEILTREGAYSASSATAAVRLNDAGDIWLARGSKYRHEPAAPFRTARLHRVHAVADLGLYAITFYNDLEIDRRTLEAYAAFRDEAATAHIRHFLEVFNPHFAVETPDADFAAYNNDMIVRCLAGVSQRDRPIFLKAAYNGPRATEEIASYDPGNLIFGILGGAAGTTRDCLELIKQAERYGARVALFGRKIYFSEDSVTMLRAMRRVLDEEVSSLEGTKAYHADLERLGIRPKRALEDDLEITDPVLKQAMG